MAAKKPDPPPHLSDSDRVALDELRAEKEFERRLADKRKARFERIKAWVTFGTALLVLRSIVWDQLKAAWDFLASHIK